MDQNPLGIPFKLHKNPAQSELEGLQVKAELSKLGDAPRAYAEHLTKTKENAVMSFNESRLKLSERFAKI